MVDNAASTASQPAKPAPPRALPANGSGRVGLSRGDSPVSTGGL